MTAAEDFIAHYASQYYDPVKAREYYLRNKKAGAARAGKPKSEAERKREGRQNEAIGYTRQNIAKEKNKVLTKASDNNRANLERLRADAQVRAARIKDALKASISGIEGSLKIPENASPKLRAFLLKQQRMQTQSARQKSSKELQALGTNMRDAINKARVNYQTARETMLKKYDTTVKTEDAGIRKNIK